MVLTPPLLGQVGSARYAKLPLKEGAEPSGNTPFLHAHAELESGAQLWPQQAAILQEPMAFTCLQKRENIYEYMVADLRLLSEEPEAKAGGWFRPAWDTE